MSTTTNYPDPRQAVMAAQDLADHGNTLVSITLSFDPVDLGAGRGGIVVYDGVGAYSQDQAGQRRHNKSIIDTAAATLDSNDAGGAGSK